MQACRRGFPESLGRQFGGLPSPWGCCVDRSPGEESTGVVVQKTLPA